MTPGYEVIDAEERREVEDVFDNGGVLFRHGFEALRNGSYKVRDFERAFAEKFGVSDALAVSSGTAAIRVALASFGIGPGDEVITQSFTFVATVEAIVEAGATPVCAEIDETLNIDVQDAARLISPRTKAIIAVHMLGTPCDIRALRDLCDSSGVLLIEDTAWGCGGHLNDRLLGTWGDAAAFSFDHAKALTTGEGGMVIHADPERHLKARAWHDHGHENNPNLPRWEDSRNSSGFNFRMSELQGAVGLVQLTKLDRVLAGQRSTATRIRHLLGESGLDDFRPSPSGSQETDDAVIVRFESSLEAKAFREALLREGLSTKILPEALTWHFAGFWTHIEPLVRHHGAITPETWPKSFQELQRCAAIPTLVFPDESFFSKLATALDRFPDTVLELEELP